MSKTQRAQQHRPLSELLGLARTISPFGQAPRLTQQQQQQARSSSGSQEQRQHSEQQTASQSHASAQQPPLQPPQQAPTLEQPPAVKPEPGAAAEQPPAAQLQPLPAAKPQPQQPPPPAAALAAPSAPNDLHPRQQRVPTGLGAGLPLRDPRRAHASATLPGRAAPAVRPLVAAAVAAGVGAEAAPPAQQAAAGEAAAAAVAAAATAHGPAAPPAAANGWQATESHAAAPPAGAEVRSSLAAAALPLVLGRAAPAPLQPSGGPGTDSTGPLAGPGEEGFLACGMGAAPAEHAAGGSGHDALRDAELAAFGAGFEVRLKNNGGRVLACMLNCGQVSSPEASPQWHAALHASRVLDCGEVAGAFNFCRIFVPPRSRE